MRLSAQNGALKHAATLTAITIPSVWKGRRGQPRHLLEVDTAAYKKVPTEGDLALSTVFMRLSAQNGALKHAGTLTAITIPSVWKGRRGQTRHLLEVDTALIQISASPVSFEFPSR